MDDSTVPASDTMGATYKTRLGLLWVFPDSVLNGAGPSAQPPGPKFTEIGGDAVIGRSLDSDIVVDAGQVSRRHLLIRRNGPLLVAEDLQSRNGSYHNGERFDKTLLEPGSLIRIGEALAIVRDAAGGIDFSFSELGPGFWGGHTLAARLGQLRRVAGSDLSVIVQGETGTGKEGVALALHHYSGRSGRFVAINCAALPESLIESQLFGHRRGAFTGAERSEVGYIGASDGGTLFLDEVLELRPSIQSRLLRVLQEREFTPLGDTRPVRVDLRVVVASQSPLEHAVANGTFREDLYARLNGYQVTLPPLCDRREDIPFLFRHFLAERFGGKPPELRASLLEALCLHEWPRNVRELETFAKRLSVLHGHRTQLGLDQLADALDAGQSPPGAKTEPGTNRPSSRRSEPAQCESESLREQESNALVSALNDHDGNVVRAAKQLGISRSRAYRQMLALGIDVQRYRKRSLRGQA
jgi:transcriptional regulator of acetoin/glycerol metabolism